jgi:hypothetical protein
MDALVDSRHTRALALKEVARRLIEAPVWLAAEPDIDALRGRMDAAKAGIGRALGATTGGNPTKCIWLRALRFLAMSPVKHNG